jgi:hypothetical protein
MIHTNKILSLLKNHQTGFIYIKGYTNAKGEVSNYLINVGFKYAKIKKQDFKIIEQMDFEYVASNEYSVDDWNDAIFLLKQKLINYELRKNNYSNSNISLNSQRSLIINQKNNKVKLRGLVVKKQTIKECKKRKTRKSPVSIARSRIEELYLKRSKFRLFDISRCESISLCGIKLINETL